MCPARGDGQSEGGRGMTIAEQLAAIESRLLAADMVGNEASHSCNHAMDAGNHWAAITILSRIYGPPCGEPDCNALVTYDRMPTSWPPFGTTRAERPSDPCRNCDWPRSCHAEVAK